MRNLLLNIQLNFASPTHKIPAVRNAVEKVMMHALPSEATVIPSVVTQAVEESIAKIIVQQNELSWISSLGQKVG